MKLEAETTIESLSAINDDLLVSAKHISRGICVSGVAPGADNLTLFIRSVEFGASKEEAKRLFVGHGVKIIVEVIE